MSANKKLAEKKPLFNNTLLVGIILAAAALAAMYFITPTETLTRAGINTIGLLVATICLLICRSLPMATLGILLVPLTICGLCAFMIPIDTLPLMAYNYGYYSVGTQVKATIPICLFISVITAIWVPLTTMFGLW